MDNSLVKNEFLMLLNTITIIIRWIFEYYLSFFFFYFIWFLSQLTQIFISATERYSAYGRQQYKDILSMRIEHMSRFTWENFVICTSNFTN